METAFWRKCSSCKKTIGFGSRYYACSVSTCNGQRTGYVFCSVPCFEVHLPGARHKDAAAIEQKAPASGSVNAAAQASGREPQRLIVKSSGPGAEPSRAQIPREVLIIASRLKDYIVARAQMNTSADVMEALSDHVRRLCDVAIDHAREDGRKTVMDRDFDFLKK